LQDQDHLFFSNPRPVRSRPRPFFQDQDQELKKRSLTEKSGQLCWYCPVMPELCR